MEQDISQHFGVWRAFNKKIYQSTLTGECIVGKGNAKYIDKVAKIEGVEGNYTVNEEHIVRKKCIELEKGKVRYLLPLSYLKLLPIQPKDFYDCYLKKSDKIVYRMIVKPQSVRVGAERTMSLKELVKRFNPVNHSNPETLTFLKIQAIASKAKGGKYRLCGPPASMKNANDTIIKAITNDTTRVSKPTLAKLETLFYYNQKVLPDEMTSLTTAQLRDVESFFLTIADEDPTFSKHSMASNKDMNEVDISSASCVFTYNDPDSLRQGSTFFDDLWQNPEAFNSRYPAFYVGGEVIDALPKLSTKQANTIMEQNFSTLREIAKNVIYYVRHLTDELHGWDRSKFIVKGRSLPNVECILDGFDVFSDSQEEYDYWIEWMNDSLRKYKKLRQPTQTGQLKVTEEVIR